MLVFFCMFAQANPEVEFRNGMWALNGWAVGNMSGMVGTIDLEDPQSQAFYQMNAGWNVVNAGLASFALLDNKPIRPKKLAKIFWINAALDVLYIAGGAALRHQGLEKNNPQWVGWGDSIILQGGFLLTFDSLMGWRMQRSQPIAYAERFIDP